MRIWLCYDGTSQRVASVKRTTDAGHTTGPTTTYAYSSGAPCAAGETKTVVTDPNSHDTTYCANTKDRVLKVLDAVGNERSRTYTSNGDVNDATDTPGGTGAAGLTSLQYDTDNNLTNVTGAEQESGSIDYFTSTDADGGGGPLAKFRPKKATDDQGTSEFYKYDSKGNLTSVADAASSPRNKATLAYNVPGNGVLTSATDGNLNTTSFGHDTAGNLTSIAPPTPLLSTTLTVDGLSRVKTALLVVMEHATRACGGPKSTMPRSFMTGGALAMDIDDQFACRGCRELRPLPARREVPRAASVGVSLRGAVHRCACVS